MIPSFDPHVTQSRLRGRDLSNEGSEGGFPHSKFSIISAFAAPRDLFAAYHVLHRLSAPKASTDALKGHLIALMMHARSPLGTAHGTRTADPSALGSTKEPSCPCGTDKTRTAR